MRIQRHTAAVAVGLLALFTLDATAGDEWKKTLGPALSSQSSAERYNAIKGLDPNDEDQREVLYKVLSCEIFKRLPQSSLWYSRQAAIEVLQTAYKPEALEDMRKQLDKNRNPLIREGLVLALGGRKDHELVPDLAEALGDKEERVRLAAAKALQMVPHKDGVDALIAAYLKEKDLEVDLFIKTALEEITGQYFGLDKDRWELWWANAKRDFTVGGAQEAEGDEKPEEHKSTLRGVDLDYKEVGQGPPLLVLPDYSFSRSYLETHLTGLADVARVFFIDLPPITSFSNLKQSAVGIPEYPIDQLCDAFDELRQQYKQERVAILAHGISCWIAMRYATKYPNRISHIIMVAPYSGGQAYSNGITRMEGAGKGAKPEEEEVWKYAQTLIMEQSGPRYSPTSQAEGESLMRRMWSLYFADQSDPFISWSFPALLRPMGQCVVDPQFNVGKEGKGQGLSVLIITGKHAVFTSVDDAKAIQKHYSRSHLSVYQKSRRAPFIEENDRFVAEVKGFFKKYPFERK